MTGKLRNARNRDIITVRDINKNINQKQDYEKNTIPPENKKTSNS